MESIRFEVRCHRHGSCLSGCVALNKFFILNNFSVSSFVKWETMEYTSSLQRWNGIAWKYLTYSSYLISVIFLDWLIDFIHTLSLKLPCNEGGTNWGQSKEEEVCNIGGCCWGGAFTLGLNRAKKGVRDFHIGKQRFFDVEFLLRKSKHLKKPNLNSLLYLTVLCEMTSIIVSW